uniref:FLYWCH-type domain-containing protein n=2 Tax=Meloidogyne TaxID=189290 RepID=A0A915NEE4_9BILA
MFEFHYYNPEQPRIITSFKGNQKLILGGYRYNIHHVKDGVNNKTWRCVCAKKLTGARSWCKGRAETWEGDTKGIPKGEHNHQTEHDLAELEYFKSQLIFAAISEPTTDLNLLIDEATKFLSPGLSFGNRESMKKSLIVARKSAESGELVLGQLPYRSKKSVKRASVRSKAAAVSKNAPQVKNPSTSTPILPQSSQSTSRQRSTPNNRTSTGSYSPFSPNISVGSRSNNSSGIGSSLSSSDCLDISSFSSMGCNTQQNNWNQNSHFEMPSISALNNTFTEGVEASSSSINPYGTVNMTMPSEILAAALYAVAMLGSAQASQNQNQQNQQFQEAVNNSTLPIPPKRVRVNNNPIANRATTNGASPMRAITPLTNSVAKISATEGNLKRKGARVNGILQKLSTKVAAVSTSPPALTTPMELVREEMSKCPNTLAIKEEKEELNSNPMPQKGLLVSVQTQTDNMNEMVMRYTNEDRINGNNSGGENGKAKLNGFINHPPKRLICCCCFDEVEGLNVDEFPVGCKKRAKLLLENEAQQCDKEKSLSPASKIKNKEDGEEKQNEENNNVSGMELFESDNELKLEIEEEDDEDS